MSRGFTEPAGNPCLTANGGCEDLCLQTDLGTRRCQCTDPNAVLRDDKMTCGCLEGYKEVGVTCEGVCQQHLNSTDDFKVCDF